MLGFGLFDFFPKTRQSPHFEIIVPTKSKSFFKERFSKYSHFQHFYDSWNRKGEINSAHLADIHIDKITDDVHKDNKFLKGTSNLKKTILEGVGGDYNDIRAKAKISFSIDGFIEFI